MKVSTFANMIGATIEEVRGILKRDEIRVKKELTSEQQIQISRILFHELKIDCYILKSKM